MLKSAEGKNEEGRAIRCRISIEQGEKNIVEERYNITSEKTGNGENDAKEKKL